MRDGSIDLSNAYDTKIGEWDKRTIMYGYSQFPKGQESLGLKKMIDETIKLGYTYMSDADARPVGSAHPNAHLWDNGSDPVLELQNISSVRKQTLSRFGVSSLQNGAPFSNLENMLVPLYLAHRYQVEAAAKLIGGMDYTYKTKGDAHERILSYVDADTQKKALTAILNTLEPSFLTIPEEVLKQIPPQAAGYSRDRESFYGHTGLSFDPLAAAEASANHSLSLLLHPERLSRIIVQYCQDGTLMNLERYFSEIQEALFFSSAPGTEYEKQITLAVQKLYVLHLIKLQQNTRTNKQVQAMASYILSNFMSALPKVREVDSIAHFQYLQNLIDQAFNQPDQLTLPAIKEMPPGSPIGCGGIH
jgi:hypothetical protein